MKILIAEDDSISRTFLKKMIEGLGYTVVEAEDGQAAWGRIAEDDIRILITDWDMPGMDGLELCRQIRARKDADYIYVIVVTAMDNTADAVQGLAAGADDYIVKPFDPEELQVRIRSGLRILTLESDYKRASTQLLQSEKLASIGQLAAGVAHEINNPTGFVSSNLKTMTDYVMDVIPLIDAYRDLTDAVRSATPGDLAVLKQQAGTVAGIEADIDIDFIKEDIQALLTDCREGTERIKKIVLDLKDFAHPGEEKLQQADINQCIESTLNVVWNELKYKAEVHKQFSELPMVTCYPHMLNQVFMNLLVNAAQAIPEKGDITIETAGRNGWVEIRVSDTGLGIPSKNLKKLFEPFFTTKAVGKGTGLGLNVAYNIVQKHGGEISVKSAEGQGTMFTVRLPVDGVNGGDAGNED